MILVENEIDSQFYNNVMRMYNCEEARRIQEEIDDIIMFEIELSNFDFFESGLDMGQASVSEKKADPIIAIIKRPTSDSRRRWMVDKLVVGTRSNFSA